MMIRSTRKTSIMGATIGSNGVTSDVVSRNGGTLNVTHLHNNNHAKNKNPYSMSHGLSSMNITGSILSHLATALATVLLVMLASSIFTDRENVDTSVTMTPGKVGRNMNHNEIGLRRAQYVNESNIISSLYYDVVVVGVGPAGLTAALFAARAGLHVLVVGSETGLLSEATKLGNFPSWFDVFAASMPDESNSMASGGIFWLETTKLQAVAAGVHFALPGLMVSKITQTFNELYSLNISGKFVDTMTVIIATGASGRKLDLPNEALLWGKSIHSCAICDGSSYKNKTVVVVGGGDAAVDAAILLSRYARSVVLVHRRETFRASNKQNLRSMFAAQTITVKTPFIVTEILLEDSSISLSHLHIRNIDTNETDKLECDGVFIMIGSTPNTQFLQDFVNLDDEGFIGNQYYLSEASTGTSMEGIFAAGEVTDKLYKQAITASAAGARAAIDAERWLRKQPPHMTTFQRALPESIPLKSFSNGQPFIGQEQAQNKLVSTSKPDPEVKCNDFSNAECVEAVVQMYPVVMFSLLRCPQCTEALEVLSTEGAITDAILVIDIDGLNEHAIRSNLDSITGRRTVPNIFIGGRNIGGIVLLNRLQKLGELRTILETANATQKTVKRKTETTEEDVSKTGRDVECNDFRRTDCIQAVVNKYPVVVFSKPSCPSCKKALEALALEGVTRLPTILVVNLDGFDAPTIQSNLESMTGRRTVPNVFVGGRAIGGGDETLHLQRNGALRTLLVDAKAIA